MFRKALFALSFILLAAGVFGQSAKTLTLSPDFSAVPGTPRAIFNSSKNVWVVVWHQGTAIRARTVAASGALGAAKNLATGATSADQSFDIALDTGSSSGSGGGSGGSGGGGGGYGGYGAPNSVNADEFSYLLAFENGAGLQVRAINPSLVPGATHLVEEGTRGGMARVIYDPVGNGYFMFWLGTQDGTRSVLKARVLDSDGNPKTNTVVLTSAGSGKTFDSLNVARNPTNGNMLAIALQGSGASGAVLKVDLKPDGTLSGTPATFQALTAGLQTIGSVSFSSAGTGFGLWVDKTSVKRRKVTSTGSFGSGATPITTGVDVNSRQVGITFSPSVNQFIAAWAKGNQIFAANLNSTTGAPLKSPAAVTTSQLTFSRNAYVSADSQGNALAIWEDSNVDASTVNSASAKFRVRAAIIGAGGGGGTANVSVQDNFYSPASITVSAGTTVVWTFNGSHGHTVTSGSPTNSPGSIFTSATQSSGTFNFTFTQKGSFAYFCKVHGSAMTGTVTVQ